MTKKERLLQEVDERGDKMVTSKTEKTETKTLSEKGLSTLKVLAAWLLMLLAKEKATAQESKVQDPQLNHEEMVYQIPDKTLDSTITFTDTIKTTDLETDDEWWEELEWWDGPDDEEPIETPDTTKKDESKFSIGWMVQFWTGVAWDAAEVLSSRPELLTVLDISHKKTWLWISFVRVDDFSSDITNPFSQVTIVNPYWSTTLWKDGKFRVTAEWKYTFVDKMPEASWFSPDLKLSYSDKWWTIEWMYIHKFQKWPDSDAFRLSVSKKLDEILELTAQWWYETWYDKHFFGRLIATVDLWHGYYLEMSCIAKHGEFIPTIWVIKRWVIKRMAR